MQVLCNNIAHGLPHHHDDRRPARQDAGYDKGAVRNTRAKRGKHLISCPLIYRALFHHANEEVFGGLPHHTKQKEEEKGEEEEDI